MDIVEFFAFYNKTTVFYLKMLCNYSEQDWKNYMVFLCKIVVEIKKPYFCEQKQQFSGLQ